MSDDHEDDFSDDSEAGSDNEKYEASFVDDVQQSQVCIVLHKHFPRRIC